MKSRIERIFLDWSSPVLASAAQVLVDRFRNGGEVRLDRALVALPGARAGRRLLEHLLQVADSGGLRLVPPSIVTVGAIPELLVEPTLPFADELLPRLVWIRALRASDPDRMARVFPRRPAPDDLLGWHLLARQVQRLHRELGGAARTFGDVAAQCAEGLLFDDGERWRALSAVQDEFRRRLDALGRLDRQFHRLAALEGPSLPCGREVWLVGVVELPPAIRHLLSRIEAPVRAVVHAPADRADDFDAFGCVRPAAWLDAAVPIVDRDLEVVDGPAHQATAALRAVARLDGRFAADEITLGVPDDEVTPFLWQRFSIAGLPVRAAAGVPLARSGPVRMLQSIAAYLEGRRFEDFAALLRHPDLRPWLRRRDADADADVLLGEADRYLSERLPATVAGGIRGDRPATSGLARALRTLDGEDGLGRLAAPRRLSEWATEIGRLLVDIYGSGPLDPAAPADRVVIDACARIGPVTSSFRELPIEVDEVCQAPVAIRLLLSQLEGEAVPAEAGTAAIEMLGWLELHLDDAPALVLTGMNDPYVPEAANADAFLPNALRARLGLPDNDSRRARDAYLLTAILRSRQVHLIAGRRGAAGDPLRPSRLLLAADPVTIARRVLRYFGDGADAAEAPDAADSAPAEPGAARSRFVLPPEPVLAAPSPLASLRVTDFRAILQDPYRFALERVTGLGTLDDEARELDGLAFGSLAHDVLSRLVTTAEIAATDADRIAARLDTLLDTAVLARYGARALPAVHIQAEQLRARLHAFARWHAEWIAAGWHVLASEIAPPAGGFDLEVDGVPIFVRGRIDRIDVHPDLGWAVFDYKTADRGDPPEKTHRRGRAEAAEWVDLQLPLYRHLLQGLRTPDGDPLLPAGAGAAARLGYILLPRDLPLAGAAFADWSEADFASADEAARQVVRFVRGNRFAFDTARPSSWSDDPFAALLGLGQFANLDGDEGDES